jgi:AcrR family transcriptional regulator
MKSASKPKLKAASVAPSPREEAKLVYRRAILEAAEHELGVRGFHAARMQDIAARAGLAVGTLYNHFEQKEDILRALLDERSDELATELQPLVGDPEKFAPRLLVRLQRLLAFLERHRDFYALALENGLLHASERRDDPAAAARRDRKRAPLRALVEEGIALGALDEELGPELLLNFLGACIRAGAFDALRDPKVRLAERAPTISRLFLKGAGKSKRS